MIINAVTNVLIVLIIFVSIIFVSVYASGPWKVSPLGKATMLWAVSMIVWCTSGLLYSAFGGLTSWYPWIRLAAYLAVGVSMSTMLTMLIKTSRQVRKDRREDSFSS